MTTVSIMLQLLCNMTHIFFTGRRTPDAEVQHMCKLAYDGSGQGWYGGKGFLKNLYCFRAEMYISVEKAEIVFIYDPVKKRPFHVDGLIFIKCENPAKAGLDGTDYGSQTLFCMLSDLFLPEITLDASAIFSFAPGP